ncbi:MAG: uroporphyrinogen-III synthase [Chitinophagales bacterium]|nr:uroporphyrinogen-III synthase [Chitinophagales bacterium]
MAKRATTSSNKTTKTTAKTQAKKQEVKVHAEDPRPVKSILISLPKPETGKSPYIDLANKFKIKLDWRPFTHVEDIKAKEFRNQKIYLDQFKNIIFTSRTSAEQYFRICEEMRIKISLENKYFCLSEAIALYLQKYIQYRKRKVFFANGKMENLIEVIKKYKDDNEEVLISSSETKDKALNILLEKASINYKEATLYRTVASDLSDLSDVKYDMLIFFNTSAIDSLYSNFPDFKQDKTRLAIYGNLTAQAVAQHKLKINVFAPLPDTPSLVDAIKKYIEVGNKK